MRSKPKRKTSKRISSKSQLAKSSSVNIGGDPSNSSNLNRPNEKLLSSRRHSRNVHCPANSGQPKTPTQNPIQFKSYTDDSTSKTRSLRKRQHMDQQIGFSEILAKSPRKANMPRKKLESYEADSPTSFRTQSLATGDCKSKQSSVAKDPENLCEFEAETNTHLNSCLKSEMAPEESQKHESILHSDSEISPKTPESPFRPQCINGRYENPKEWFHGTSAGTWRWFTWRDLLRWTLFGTNNSAVPSVKKDLDDMLPVLPLEEAKISTPSNEGIMITWLGHSSLIVQFDKLTILTDPVFSDHAGIMRYLGVKRIRKIPENIEKLRKVDAVVISHNHYDHLDRCTVEFLNTQHDGIYWFVPLGLKEWMRSVGCRNVTELDWWEEGWLKEGHPTKFVFTPAQHWSRRGLFDTNKSLWGSWSIIGPNHNFFFAGDTGYCSGFKQIGKKFGPFDLAAIPIGAYEPRWFLAPQHVDPKDAVKIHKDVQANCSIGIHWGTFILSDEPYLEPPEKFAEAAKDEGLQDQCICLRHGESRFFKKHHRLASNHSFSRTNT